ncbi:MAG: 50S ribosomal protein L11 methyltransferase [Rhodospirillales bacterium]|nr:50S ribosomal protein L11 methyltransferase [Rhodospirillales bacterium]
MPALAVPPFEAALFEVCPAVSVFEDRQHPEFWTIAGDCPTQPDIPSLQSALALAAAVAGIAVPPYTVDPTGERDWLRENLRAFPPIRAGRFFIHGAHYEGPIPVGSKIIQVDAATAFGSGEHETTRGCLLALDALAKARRFYRPIDVGTGTGILAMGAAHVWPVAVQATDIDPEAVRVARGNIRRNGLGGKVRVTCGAGYSSPEVRRGRPYDLIIANILARPLCSMARDLAAHLSPDGVVVLSGFYEEDVHRVLAAHRRVGLHLVRRIAVGPWRTLVLGR